MSYSERYINKVLTVKDKPTESKKIKSDVDKFLENGGKVEVINRGVQTEAEKKVSLKDINGQKWHEALDRAQQ